MEDGLVLGVGRRSDELPGEAHLLAAAVRMIVTLRRGAVMRTAVVLRLAVLGGGRIAALKIRNEGTVLLQILNLRLIVGEG